MEAAGPESCYIARGKAGRHSAHQMLHLNADQPTNPYSVQLLQVNQTALPVPLS